MEDEVQSRKNTISKSNLKINKYNHFSFHTVNTGYPLLKKNVIEKIRNIGFHQNSKVIVIKLWKKR